jgi:hypothetical protein
MGELGCSLVWLVTGNLQDVAGDWRFHDVRVRTEKSLQFVYSFLYTRAAKSAEFN